MSLRPFNSRNKTFLNGTLTSNIVIDTSQVATDNFAARVKLVRTKTSKRHRRLHC
jgi:hypothetical protein